MTEQKLHHYDVRTVWTCGSEGPPAKVDGFSRNHRVEIAGKPALATI